MDSGRVPVSIICVFNDHRVRTECLDRSIDELRVGGCDIDYIPVDNTARTFSTAGAALMHGAARARFDVMAFVHQDVLLHSLEALERAAGALGPTFGVLGAVGVTRQGRYFGPIRDRVVLLGETAARPVEVDSLDEVLFMVDRATLTREPLSEAPALAWHGYAVEYGLRVRRTGRRVGAVSVPLTHNSLTTNLDRLTEAHEFIARAYPEEADVRTTCGVITDAGRPPKAFATQRWRYRWVEGSVHAARIRRQLDTTEIVLSDIRLDIDELLAAVPSKAMRVVSLDRGGCFDDGPAGKHLLRRGDALIEVAARTLGEITDELSDAGWAEERPLLITNLEESDLLALAPLAKGAPTTIGLHRDAGAWLLVGAALGSRVASWSSRSAIPFRLPRSLERRD